MVDSQILIFVVMIVVVLVFRFRKIVSGGPVNKNKIIFSMISYFAISMFAVFSSFQAGVSYWYVFAYVGVLMGATYLSHRHVDKSIIIWKADDGKIHAKGGNVPYVIWVIGLVSRFILGYAFLGSNYLTASFSVQQNLSPFDIEITLVVDLIMMLGVGALAGRNLRLISKLKSFQIT
ncbi:MAG TPA: hypothetical protein VJ571_06205 [Candidatus Nitrosotalea sp.]|nr:hypothetical protein [Candidatus Nitrosotalea sp.]